MKYVLVAFWLAAAPVLAANDADSEMIVMSMEIHMDGELVSEPRVAFEPGTDASVMQGVGAGDSGGDIVMMLAFHSIHLHESGPEILLDVDFGLDDTEHVEARHLRMAWNEPYELGFSVASDAPKVRIVMTPSLAKRSDFLLNRKHSPD